MLKGTLIPTKYRGQTFSFKDTTEPRTGKFKAFNLGPALWVGVLWSLHHQAFLIHLTDVPGTVSSGHLHLNK